MKGQIKLIRKMKYWLYSLGIHRLIPRRSFLFLGNMAGLSKWISQNKNIGFTSFPTSKFDYGKRFDLYGYVAENEIKNEAVDYFEFGVAKGTSFKWWLGKNTNSESRFYGFDTFTGLPEDWGPFKKGAMSNGNKPPEIEDSRGEFFQGLFQQTFVPFLQNYQPHQRKVILMDADLFSSTLFVLTTFSQYLKKGDIIIFDEFNVPMHEYKAFKDWTESFYIEYEVLGEVNNFYQTAIKLK